MPPKMVECVMCKEMVSKRQSWDLKALGSKKTGRVCKKHPQISEIVDEVRAEKLIQMDMDRADRTMRIISGVAFVQVMHSFFGMPLIVAYYQLEQRGFKPKMIEEVKAQVAEQGGPQMSEQQKLMAVIAAQDLHKRGVA